MSLLCPELIGRVAEVALLRERVEAMADGRGGVVVLVAEGRAGKTRLAAAATESAAARGCPVLTGRAVPGPNPCPTARSWRRSSGRSDRRRCPTRPSSPGSVRTWGGSCRAGETTARPRTHRCCS